MLTCCLCTGCYCSTCRCTGTYAAFRGLPDRQTCLTCPMHWHVSHCRLYALHVWAKCPFLAHLVHWTVFSEALLNGTLLYCTWLGCVLLGEKVCPWPFWFPLNPLLGFAFILWGNLGATYHTCWHWKYVGSILGCLSNSTALIAVDRFKLFSRFLALVTKSAIALSANINNTCWMTGMTLDHN